MAEGEYVALMYTGHNDESHSANLVCWKAMEKTKWENLLNLWKVWQLEEDGEEIEELEEKGLIRR